MDSTLPMNRRDLALTFGAIWASLALPGDAAAQPWTPVALTAAQARILDVAAELIMPATDTPGARDAGVPQFVDRAVAGFCTPADVQAIRAGLDRMEADARADHGAAFVALTPAQQTALLTRYDSEARARREGAFFPVLRDLVTVGYFTSRIGATQAARYDPNPGDYRGCVPMSEIGRVWAT